MKRKRPQVEDFAIGWICALSIELSAANVVLDEEYEGVEGVSQYILGRVGEHNIVITCLPAGQYGTTAAAVVAAKLEIDFPNVQYWLMVGIGGGVPSSSNDVRLGDVVVGQPQNQHGGVVQYDLGKTHPDGRHERTGLLNAPPTVLGMAVSRLQSRHNLQNSILQPHLSMFSQWVQFQRPRLSDELYVASYIHAMGPTCANCSPEQRIARSDRLNTDPQIHFGLIASGNQVIKDGIIRDRLSAELGGVLCFEMEAAGLMNNFPCLVIRGVCDYADSHKNKRWQMFAAATAAACAKEILLYIPTKVASLTANQNPSRRSVTDSYSSGQEKTNPKGNPTSRSDRAEPVSLALTDTQIQDYLESLKFASINSRHATIRTAQTRTCTWVLAREEFLSWLDDRHLSDHHGFFWIKGKPATGKSTLMKFLLFETSKMLPQAITVSFFFNARGEELERSTSGMYRSMLSQLIAKRPSMQEVLLFYPPKINPNTGSPEWDITRLRTVLEHAIMRLYETPLTVFVDALDECGEEEIREMVSFFEYLSKIAVEKAIRLRICFSSRHYPHISIENSIQLVLERQHEHEQDIKAFIQEELKGGQDQFFEDIRLGILQRSSGIFLWAVLVVKILNKLHDQGRQHQMASRLRTIPDSLEHLFEEMMVRDQEDMEELKLCLQWLLFATRPLKTTELYHALLTKDDSDLDDSHSVREISPQIMRLFVVNVSKGLVEETESLPRTVQFIHESVRDFFLKGIGLTKFRLQSPKDFEADGHEQLKHSCINCLVHPTIHQLVLQHTSHKELVRHCPLLDYAVQNALYHSNKAASAGFSQARFIEQFPFKSWLILHKEFPTSSTEKHTDDVCLLYVLAAEGLSSLIETEFNRIGTIEVRGGKYGFPLLAATASKDTQTLRALLKCHLRDRTDVSQQELSRAITILTKVSPRLLNVEATQLIWAACVGDYILWKIFLPDGKVDVEIVEQYGELLLVLACMQGHIDLVATLLEHGAGTMQNIAKNSAFMERLKSSTSQWIADRTSKDSKIWRLAQRTRYVTLSGPGPGNASALSSASANGHSRIVELLLKHNTNVEQRSESCLTATLWAVLGGHVDITKQLLSNIAKAEANKALLQTAASVAASSKSNEILELLLANGADLNGLDHDGQTLLMTASSSGYVQIVQTLLNIGAEVNKPDVSGQTALSCASQGGHHQIVDILLTQGAKDSSAMAKASRQGHLKVVKQLCMQEEYFEWKDERGMNALSYAAGSGSFEIVKLLLAHKYAAHWTAHDREVALRQAIMQNSIEAVKALLEYGLSAVGAAGNAALRDAAIRGYSDIVSVLLSNGVECDVRDEEGSTALHHAACQGHFQVVKSLTAGGANVNLQNHVGQTVLLATLDNVGGYNAWTFDNLLTLSVEINNRDERGRTALWYTASNGFLYNMQQLLTKGADSNICDNEGVTPLMVASQYTSPNSAKLLLDHGADVNAVDNYGASALSNAAGSGSTAVVDLLLASGANVHQRDQDNRTILMAASYYGHTTIVRTLLEHGIACGARATDGKTALSYAIAWGHIKIADILRMHLRASGVDDVNDYRTDESDDDSDDDSYHDSNDDSDDDGDDDSDDEIEKAVTEEGEDDRSTKSMTRSNSSTTL